MLAKQLLRQLAKTPQDMRAKRHVKSLHKGEYTVQNVPYQCQFASPELAKDILEKRIEAKDDPKWKVFGYKTREESEYWAWRQCGVCCAKMALEYYGKQPGAVANLTEQGVKLGGYNTETDEGWYYKPLAALIRSYGLAASVAPYLSVEQLVKNISEDKLAIISVNPEIIRGDKKITNFSKSGHLVLVVGVKIEHGKVVSVRVSNPSGKTKETQAYGLIPIDDFTKAYGKKGIVIGKA